MFKNSIIALLFMLFASSLVTTAQAVECGDVVTGNITLTSNLDCSTGFRALEVHANNVTIDLNGHTLSGTADLDGISASRIKNLTVTNGSIKGFHIGVNTGLTNALKVNNVLFYETSLGISIGGGNHAIIENNKFVRTNTGVSISNVTAKTSASNNLVNNNEFYRAKVGVDVCGDHADSNSITNNLIWKTVNYGIHLTQSDRNQIINNRILETGDSAIRLDNSSYSFIEGNTLQEGLIGLSILANANTACLENGNKRSYKNSFKGNYSLEFKTGVVLGSGASSSVQVLKNTLTNNKIYDDDVGIYFQSDAHQNTTSNGYQGTITPIIDNGVDNTY